MISGRSNSQTRLSQANDSECSLASGPHVSTVSLASPPFDSCEPSGTITESIADSEERTDLRELRMTARKVAHELNNVMTVLLCRSAQLTGTIQGSEVGLRILSEFDSVLDHAAQQVRLLSQACRKCDRHVAP